jgi:hypothetical protein
MRRSHGCRQSVKLSATSQSPGRLQPVPDLLPRQLTQVTADGEQMPFEFPSAMPCEGARLWLEAEGALDSDLTIVIEDQHTAWLAVMGPKSRKPLLLMKLPIWHSVATLKRMETATDAAKQSNSQTGLNGLAAFAGHGGGDVCPKETASAPEPLKSAAEAQSIAEDF